ncbi:MAG: hypothetical protein WD696_17625 [Bryobacteraceae bacterium]
MRYEDGLCITTNTVEGFFAILKRGINGIYPHVSKQQLGRTFLESDDQPGNSRYVVITDSLAPAPWVPTPK